MTKFRKGTQFGYWTVIRTARVDKHAGMRLRVRCVCGLEKDRLITNLIYGASKSCGCMRQDRIVHGFSKTKLYVVYANMMKRCYYPKHHSYRNYGGRGITVCNTWRDNPASFFSWAKKSWKEGLQLDRKDNSRGYSPKNCRFVTPVVNSSNKRTTRYMMYRGEKLSIAEIARRESVSYLSLWRRVVKWGWPLRRALHSIHQEGAASRRKKPLTLIARENGVSYQSLVRRLRCGMDIDEAVKRLRK